MYVVVAIVFAIGAGVVASVTVPPRALKRSRMLKPDLKHAAKAPSEQMWPGALGVYRLHWHSGGSSVAAVGMLDDGTRWYAPANWTNREPGAIASTDWSLVKHADLIEP